MTHNMIIGGRAYEAASGERIDSFDPYRGAPWTTIPRGGAPDADAAVESAHAAFEDGPWGKMTPSERGRLLCKLADKLEQHTEELAALESRDNGKIISETSMQTRYIPSYYRYFGGLSDKVEGGVLPIDKPNMLAFTRWEPLGVVTAITAWNSPLMLAAWKLAPALAAGNTIVLKPSEHASATSFRFAELALEAGLPPGVLNVVSGYGHEVGQALVAHPKVVKVTFTGGEAGGRAVYQAAAAYLKPVTLELGGKSPNIVFEDADLDSAVAGVISGIFAASGQTCIAGSRLLLQRSIYDKFLEKLLTVASAARLGDPSSTETQIGPVTTRAQYEKILSLMKVAKEEGCEAAIGGGVPELPECGQGWFVEPTIFTGVTPEMTIAQEEVFGPVLSVIPFETEQEAVAIANGTRFGLAAGVWTQNIARSIRMHQALQAGTVWVNTYRTVSYMAPFGGYKSSGIGRENGQEAIKEFLHQKSVLISADTSVSNPFVMR